MSFVMDSSTKAVESYAAKDNNHSHEHESELGFVDTVIHPCELQAYPIVQRTRDCLADDAENEG